MSRGADMPSKKAFYLHTCTIPNSQGQVSSSNEFKWQVALRVEPLSEFLPDVKTSCESEHSIS